MYDYKQNEQEGVAVIGLAGRWPGAENVEQYWYNICNGIECISYFSDTELLELGIDPELIKKPNFIKARGVLGNTDLIDAQFFGLHAREAALMDPQHRLFLECAWKAFESAGYCPENHQGRVGVFGGSSMNTYMFHNLQALLRNIESVESLQVSIGNDKDSLTTEVAYRLNLKGPAVTIQSSSSTSLTAVHYACQSLLNYESDMALAGGVSIHFPEKSGYLYMDGGTTSSDGHCRAFDARADGFVAGHGAGVVLLKRVADALEDGDTIWAVIKGSAVNNDGAVRVSYMAPGVEGQSEVFAIAQAIAGVSPEDISYIEAHGTGTRVGDPIELTSLKQVFTAVTAKKNFCAIGSVKPNIGHLDSAAGISGLIKTVLMLKHKKLPPQINFTQPNPELDIENSPFYINTELRDWEAVYRIAGVNSFGMGGTNTHVIIAEPPEAEPRTNLKSAALLVLSAKTETALDQATRNLAGFLEANPSANLHDVAYTLHTGRNQFDHRRALVCSAGQDAVDALKAPAAGRVFSATVKGMENRMLFFLFPDESAFTGARFKPLATSIFQDIPLIKKCLDSCLEWAPASLKADLKKILAEAESIPEASQKSLLPLAVFVIEYSLGQVLLEWGIKPQGMLGRGAGEYAAACLSGVMSPRDAINCLTNSSSSQISTLQEPAIPFLSGLTGNWITNTEATDPLYWQKPHPAVQFPGAVKDLLKGRGRASATILLEVSPGAELAGQIEREIMTGQDPANNLLVLSCRPEGHPYRTDYAAFLETVGRLWLFGCPLDSQKLQDGQADSRRSRGRITLPTYPFEYKSHWVEPVKEVKQEFGPELPPENQKLALEDWFYIPAWKREDFSGAQDWAAAGKIGPNGPCLVLVSEPSGPKSESLSQPCISRLKALGLGVIIVSSGQGYTKLEPDHYQINPLIYQDYEQLIRDLNESGMAPDSVVDFRSLVLPIVDGAGRNYLQDFLTYGFNGLLYLVKALEGSPARNDMRFTVISSKTLDVSGVEEVTPEKTTLLGACKVIPQEYAWITCRYLDVTLPTPGSAQEKLLVTQLVQEIIYGAPQNQVIAYRGAQRFIQTVESLKLGHEAGSQSLLKSEGAYLILGGLGTIGYSLAEALARWGKVRLALTGSTSLPEPEQWDAWLSGHGKDDPISAKIQKLQALRALDCEVIYVQADIGDQPGMKAALKSIKAKFKGLNGVIDAAGAVNDELFKPIRKIDFQNPARNLQTKWDGLYVLEEVLGAENLDFCLLCSSLAAMLGGLGMAEYTAGNLFMDAFAASRNRASGSFWISVNWDAFAATSRKYQEFGTPLLDLALTAEEAKEVFIRLLSQAPSRNQYLVSTSSLQRRIQRWVSTNHQDLTNQGAPAVEKEKVARLPRPELQNSYIAPQTKLEKELAEVWGRVLGLQSVGIHDNFFELGGNSLVGVELIGEIKNLYDYQVSFVDIYESPTIKALSELIAGRDHIEEQDSEQMQKSLDRGQRRRERILRNKGEAENE